MVFNFFKKKAVIEDVEAKLTTPAAKSAPMTFDEALVLQALAESAKSIQDNEQVQAAANLQAQEKAAAIAAENEAKAKTEAAEKAAAIKKAAAIEKAQQEAAALATAQKAAHMELKEATSSLEMLVQFDASQNAAPPPADAVETPQADKAPEVLRQMDTTKATREDVIAAYKIFLGRLPESMEVIDPRVGVSPAALLVDFLASKEFLDQAPKSQLVLAVAKKILDERRQVAAAEVASPAEQGPPAF